MMNEGWMDGGCEGLKGHISVLVSTPTTEKILRKKKNVCYQNKENISMSLYQMVLFKSYNNYIYKEVFD